MNKEPLITKSADFEEAIDKAVELLYQLNDAKDLYKELDKVTLEIINYLKNYDNQIDYVRTYWTDTGAPLLLQVVNNFVDKNTVWKSAAVKQYELKLVVEDDEDYVNLF